MSNYYDPWSHATHIFFKRVFQFLVLTNILGIFTWYCWVNLYFEVGMWDATKLAFSEEAGALDALLIMCFMQSATITAWLFTRLIGNRKHKSDNHYRGSRIQND